MATEKYKIDSKSSRIKLPVRAEPYWHKLTRGNFIGFRRTENGGNWIARMRTESGKQIYSSFGELSDVHFQDQFDEAKKLAEKWFSNQGENTKSGYTIQDAIDDYVKKRKIDNSEKSATDAKQRLYKHAVPQLGNIKLNKLTMNHVKKFRDSLVRLDSDEQDKLKSKDGANKLLSFLKAALNLAYKNDIIGSDRAWKRVESFKDVGTARKVFLTEEQVNELYKNTEKSFHNLVKGALLTGARYGELITATVADLDVREGTLHLDGKTGKRDCYLSDEGLSHYKELSKDKLPTALLHIRDDGDPYKRSHQFRPMKEAVKLAKLPKETTFYALRHTHISRALLAGVNIQVVAENCGTSVRMIEKHYGKFTKADRRAMFNKVKIS